MRACLRTYVHSCVQTDIYIYIHTNYTHAWMIMGACMHTYMHTSIITHPIHPYMVTSIHSCIHACMHAYIVLCVYVYTFTYGSPPDTHTENIETPATDTVAKLKKKTRVTGEHQLLISWRKELLSLFGCAFFVWHTLVGGYGRRYPSICCGVSSSSFSSLYHSDKITKMRIDKRFWLKEKLKDCLCHHCQPA